jgi:hypothetical protein
MRHDEAHVGVCSPARSLLAWPLIVIGAGSIAEMAADEDGQLLAL